MPATKQRYLRQTTDDRIPITPCLSREAANKECERLATSAKYLGLHKGLSVRRYGDGWAVYVRIA